MKISIATCPCSWGIFRADGYYTHVPYDLFLKQVQAAGYKEIELGPDGYLPVNIKVLKEELAKYHLSVVREPLLYHFIKRAMKSAWGCNRISISFGGTGRERNGCNGWLSVSENCTPKKNWTDAEWQTIYDNILDVNNYLKENFGIRMLYHPHADSAIEYLDEIERCFRSEIFSCALTPDIMYMSMVVQKNMIKVL